MTQSRELQEEAIELEKSGEVEELADILEVVYALAAVEGVSQFQLEGLRKRKRPEKHCALIHEFFDSGERNRYENCRGYSRTLRVEPV